MDFCFMNLTDCFLNPLRLAYTTPCGNEFCVITVVRKNSSFCMF